MVFCINFEQVEIYELQSCLKWGFFQMFTPTKQTFKIACTFFIVLCFFLNLSILMVFSTQHYGTAFLQQRN